jgi:hypothetical protein
MRERLGLIITVAGVIAAACVSTPLPTDPPTDASVRPVPTRTAIPTSSDVPAAASPTTATPASEPETIRAGGLAEVIVGQLRQVADPAHPEDRAFQSPRYAFERTLQPVQRGTGVYLVESRVVENRTWWRVAVDPYVGCCAPFGWIPATDRDGEPAIAPVELYCPSTDAHLTSYDFVHPESFEPPVCFGDREIEMRGYLACARPIVDAAYFLTGFGSWDQTGIECQLDDRMSVYGELVTSLSVGSPSDFEDFVDLTGYYYDPDSDTCRWTPGNYMAIPVDGAPTDTAEFGCQMRFVVTSVSPLP